MRHSSDTGRIGNSESKSDRARSESEKKQTISILKAMELLNEMVSEPYHLLHFLAFFSYFVIRTSAAQILSPQITHPLFLREIQAALALGVFAAIKVSIYFFNFSLKSLPVDFIFIC